MVRQFFHIQRLLKTKKGRKRKEGNVENRSDPEKL